MTVLTGLLDMARTYVVGVPGTGPVTLGAAVPRYQTWAAAGAVNGGTYTYGITDVNNQQEDGVCIYNSAGPSITRSPVFSTQPGNALIQVTSQAQVYFTLLKEGFPAGGVTTLDTGVGLSGGPITSTGTITLEPATTVALGGIIAGANTTINAGGTLSVSAGGGGGITSIVAGTGLGGGTITTAGTLTNAGVLAVGATAGSIVLGPNLSMTGQTLEVSAPGTGTVTSVIAGSGLGGGTITGAGTLTNAGVVHFGGVTGDVSLGTNLSMTGQTLEVTGTVGFVTSLGGETGSIAVDGGLVVSGQTLFGTIASGSAIGMVSVNGSGVMFSPTGSSDLQAAHIGLGQGFNSGTLYVLSMSGAGGVGLLGFGGAYPGVGLAATGAPSTLNNTGVLTFGGVTGDIATGPGLTIVAGNTLEVSPATTAALGGVIVGTGLSISAGTISNTGTGSGGTVTSVVAGLGLAGGTITTAGTITLDVATTAALGGVIIGSGATINVGGTLSVAAPGTGTVTSIVAGTGLGGGTISGSGTITNAGVLAVGATAGSIVLGTNLSMSGQTLEVSAPGTGTVTSIIAGLGLAGGTITGAGTVTLDVATTAALGGIIVGSGATINAGGTLSVAAPGTGTVTSIIAGAGMTGGTITGAGTVAVAAITAGLVSSNGTVLEATTLGANLNWTTGTLSITGLGSGTVTSVVAGSGLAGGTITTSGTVSLAAIAAGDFLANTTTASAVPIATALATLTAGAGLSGGPFTAASGGTLTNAGLIEFLSGTVATSGTVTIGSGLALSSNTLSASAAAPSFSDTISAAGTVQGTATTITSNINVVTTVAASSGVRLMLTPTPGFTQQVFDRGANNLNVYPASGAQIETLGANVAAVVVAGGVATFTAQTTTTWLAS